MIRLLGALAVLALALVPYVALHHAFAGLALMGGR